MEQNKMEGRTHSDILIDVTHFLAWQVGENWFQACIKAFYLFHARYGFSLLLILLGLTCRVSPVVEATSLGPASSSHLLPTNTMGMSACLPLTWTKQSIKVKDLLYTSLLTHLVNQLYNWFEFGETLF